MHGFSLQALGFAEGKASLDGALRGVRNLEDEIIRMLPDTMKAGRMVYTPCSCLAFDVEADGTAATDVEHIVALAEAHDSWIVRHAVRGLARSPGFTAAVVIILALGTGVTTAMFSFTYGVLIRPLPYPDGERIVRVGQEPRRIPGGPVYLSARGRAGAGSGRGVRAACGIQTASR